MAEVTEAVSEEEEKGVDSEVAEVVVIEEIEEIKEVEEIEETEVTEAPGEAAMRMVKVTSEVAQDHQEVTDLQELEPTRWVIFQELPLQLLIQNQFLTSSECPELLLGIC